VLRVLELIYEVTKNGKVKELTSRFSVELGSLEDAYITSRYVAREYSLEEVERLRKVVEEVKHVVREATS